jgi:hypothetical protein
LSLLPGRILPPTEPLGTVGDDGKTITINKNWYLLLWNLSAQTLGTGAPGDPGTPGTPGSPGVPSPSVYVADVDIDVISADTTALRLPISNLAIGDVDLSPVIDTTALLWAQDAILSDPAPQAQPVTVVSVGASVFTYTAAFSGTVVITGGTVSLIQIVRQGTTIATGLTAGIFPISRLDQIQITHTGAPAFTFLPT